MSNTLENDLCTRLQILLDSLEVGQAIPESEDCAYVLGALEYYVPHVIGEIHMEFRGESLDGILPVVFRKVGFRELELWGGAYLISDQSVVPIHLRIQLDATAREVGWMECYLGRRLGTEMERGALHRVLAQMQTYSGNSLSIDWYYQVGFGKRN